MTVRRTKLNVERHDLGSLRLYREDLRAIATAAAEAGDLAITCDGFEATSPEDFSDELPEKLTDVAIVAKRVGNTRFINISLSSRQAHVQLAEPDILLAGILSRIQLICAPRRRRLRSLMPDVPWIPALMMGIAISTLAIAIAAIEGTVNPKHYLGLGLVLIVVSVVLILGAWSYLIWVNRPKVIIINAFSADRPTYWQRTRDMWLIGIVTTLIGVAIGYMLGKIS